MKAKTSISLDVDMLKDLDKRAGVEGISRSELIERLCKEYLQGPEGGYWECLRIRGLPSEAVAALGSINPIDADGPIELVWRIPMAEHKAWEERRRRLREVEVKSESGRGGKKPGKAKVRHG